MFQRRESRCEVGKGCAQGGAERGQWCLGELDTLYSGDGEPGLRDRAGPRHAMSSEVTSGRLQKLTHLRSDPLQERFGSPAMLQRHRRTKAG